MPKKLLLVAGAGIALLGAALFAYDGYATPLPGNALQNVQTFSIEDSWTGITVFSPVTVHAALTSQGGEWRGPVVLSVHRWMNRNGVDIVDTQRKTVSAVVPGAVMEKVFRTLQRIPLRRGAYKPAVTHTDDYPYLTLTFQTPAQTVTFHSESNTEDRTPWQVQTAGGSFVTRSSAPNDALALLRPYLHEAVMKELQNRPGKPSIP